VAIDVDLKGDVPIDILGDVPVTLSGGLGGVGPVTLAGSIASVGPVGPVTLAGIPDTFHIHLDTVNLPKLQIGLDPLTINVAVKEIPSVRAHVPADFSLGLSVLGLDLVCLRVCGEAQVITEPYRPNPCERCGPEPSRAPTPSPAPTPGIVATPVLAQPSGRASRFDDNP
jgi:hypothetical protein